MKKIKQLAAMCALAAAAAATFTANAKTCTWIVQSGNWADSANWADGAVPEDGDSVERRHHPAARRGDGRACGHPQCKLEFRMVAHGRHGQLGRRHGGF